MSKCKYMMAPLRKIELCLTFSHNTTFDVHCVGDIWSGSEGGALKVWPWDALGKSLSLKMEERHMAALSVERSYIDPRNMVSANGFANTLTSDVTFLVSDHTRARVWSASPLTFALW